MANSNTTQKVKLSSNSKNIQLLDSSLELHKGNNVLPIQIKVINNVIGGGLLSIDLTSSNSIKTLNKGATNSHSLLQDNQLPVLFNKADGPFLILGNSAILNLTDKESTYIDLPIKNIGNASANLGFSSAESSVSFDEQSMSPCFSTLPVGATCLQRVRLNNKDGFGVFNVEVNDGSHLSFASFFYVNKSEPPILTAIPDTYMNYMKDDQRITLNYILTNKTNKPANNINSQIFKISGSSKFVLSATSSNCPNPLPAHGTCAISADVWIDNPSSASLYESINVGFSLGYSDDNQKNYKLFSNTRKVEIDSSKGISYYVNNSSLNKVLSCQLFDSLVVDGYYCATTTFSQVDTVTGVQVSNGNLYVTGLSDAGTSKKLKTIKCPINPGTTGVNGNIINPSSDCSVVETTHSDVLSTTPRQTLVSGDDYFTLSTDSLAITKFPSAASYLESFASDTKLFGGGGIIAGNNLIYNRSFSSGAGGDMPVFSSCLFSPIQINSGREVSNSECQDTRMNVPANFTSSSTAVGRYMDYIYLGNVSPTGRGFIRCAFGYLGDNGDIDANSCTYMQGPSNNPINFVSVANGFYYFVSSAKGVVTRCDYSACDSYTNCSDTSLAAFGFNQPAMMAINPSELVGGATFRWKDSTANDRESKPTMLISLDAPVSNFNTSTVQLYNGNDMATGAIVPITITQRSDTEYEISPTYPLTDSFGGNVILMHGLMNTNGSTLKDQVIQTYRSGLAGMGVVYVTSPGSNTLKVCRYETSGWFDPNLCTSVTFPDYPGSVPPSPHVVPVGLTISDNEQYLFISNGWHNSMQVRCDINQTDGSLSGCIYFGAPLAAETHAFRGFGTYGVFYYLDYAASGKSAIRSSTMLTTYLPANGYNDAIFENDGSDKLFTGKAHKLIFVNNDTEAYVTTSDNIVHCVVGSGFGGDRLSQCSFIQNQVALTDAYGMDITADGKHIIATSRSGNKLYICSNINSKWQCKVKNDVGTDGGTLLADVTILPGQSGIMVSSGTSKLRCPLVNGGDDVGSCSRFASDVTIAETFDSKILSKRM